MTLAKPALKGRHTVFNTNPDSLKRAAKRLQPLLQALINQALEAQRLAFEARESSSDPQKAHIATLAQSQEALAKALGWPSFSMALSDTEPGPAAAAPQPAASLALERANPFFSSCETLEEAYGVISALLPSAQDMWASRARLLLRGSLRFIGLERLRQMRSKDLAHGVSFATLCAWARDEAEPLEARAAIDAYLRSLPGYTPDSERQTETAKEQHSYLEMQLLPIIDSLSSLEASDPMVIPKGGFGQTRAFIRDSLGAEVIATLWNLAPAVKNQEGARLSTCLRALARCFNPQTRQSLATPLALCLENPLLLQAMCEAD